MKKILVILRLWSYIRVDLNGRMSFHTLPYLFQIRRLWKCMHRPGLQHKRDCHVTYWPIVLRDILDDSGTMGCCLSLGKSYQWNMFKTTIWPESSSLSHTHGQYCLVNGMRYRHSYRWHRSSSWLKYLSCADANVWDYLIPAFWENTLLW
jgi:hypothetical protein